MSKFKERKQQLNLSEINKEMLEAWEAASLFEASIRPVKGSPHSYSMRDPPRQTECPASTT